MTAFKTNIINVYGEQGKAWLTDLPELTHEIGYKWGLSGLTAVSNLSYNYVLSGFQGNQPIILKLGMDVDGLKREAAALKAFEGFGAVGILAESAGTLLLEHAVPGTSLKSYCPHQNAQAIHIACTVMQQLHQAPPPQGNFPHMRHWMTALDKEWEIPQLYLKKARHLRDKLLEMSVNPVLLHGDLHHENILRHGERWCVIDPKGVIGAPINEVWAFIMDIEKDTQFVADFFDFDVQEVRDWYFVHLILAACWNLEDHIRPQLFLELADKAYLLTSSP